MEIRKRIFFVGFIAGQVGCYAHTGHPTDATASQWLAWSQEACARGDRRAAMTLLERAKRTQADTHEQIQIPEEPECVSKP